MKNKFLDNVDLTKLSSKGQLVIPRSIRKRMNVKTGNVFAISSPKKDVVILKKLDSPILKEDIAIFKEVENAWKEIKQGRFKEKPKEEFLRDLHKW